MRPAADERERLCRNARVGPEQGDAGVGGELLDLAGAGPGDELGRGEVLVPYVVLELAVGFFTQGILCIGSVPGNDSQLPILDKKCIPFGIQVGLGLTVAMPILTNGGIILCHPFFTVQLRTVKLLLPNQPKGLLGGMGITQHRKPPLLSLDKGCKNQDN